MPIDVKTVDIYVDDTTLVVDESEQSFETKDVNTVDTASSIDTLLGIKDGVLKKVDPLDVNAGSAGSISFVKAAIYNGYHRDFTISASSRGVIFCLSQAAGLRGAMFYNVNSTPTISGSYLPANDTTPTIEFSHEGGVLTVTNSGSAYVYMIWMLYNGTVEIGSQVANASEA